MTRRDDPPPSLLSRRTFIGAAGALVLLAACGDDGDGDTGTAASPSGPTSQPQATTTTTTPGPARLVVLVPALLDAALICGVKPVGAPGVGKTFAPHLGDQTAGITMIDTASGPNLEQVAALRPDLIITQAGTNNGAEQLGQIARTVQVQFPIPASKWPAYVAAVADALRRTGKLAEATKAHDAKVADAAATLRPKMSGKTISLLRLGDGTVRQYGADSFAGSVLASAGLVHRQPPANATARPDGYVDVSGERLAEVAGDVVFMFDVGTESKDRLARDPLWATLPAVRAGSAYFVEQSHWLHIGYQAAARVLDDTLRLLR